MGDFKKFISTSGKSFEEIKRAINEMVNRVVDTVVDDVTQFAPSDVRRSVKSSVREARKNAAEGGYKPEKIPPRVNDTAKSSQRNESSKVVSRDPAEDCGRVHYPHEARSDHTLPHEEQMLERIAKMRELEITVRGQGIVKRAVELTMVEQGEFMADVEDDFTRRAFCALPQPVYAAMSNSQLRTFFTWRTDVRRGVYSAADKPYVLLYCYELLNKIGAESSAAALEKLFEVWENCRSFAPYLNALMPRWIKDFCVFNDVSEKYPDIRSVLDKLDNGEAGQPLFETFSEIESGDFSGKFDFLAANSAYNIKESIFFSEQTKPLIEAACEAALHALDKYFAERNIELSELVCGKLKKDYSWTPFKDAIVNLDTADGFRPVKISPSERYCVKRGEPALELFDFSPSRGFIGYLLKSVEAGLRVNTGFNRKLTPKLQMLQNDLTNRTRLMEAVSAPEFLNVISSSVDEYCRKNGITPPTKPRRSKQAGESGEAVYTVQKVEIDVSKLGEIRDKSDELARKLIIDEDLDEPRETAEQPDFPEAAEQIADDEFSAQIEEYKEELSPQEDEQLPLRSGKRVFEDLDPDWQTFANELIPVQIETLKALMNGSVRSFCKENDLLPETVFEQINTEALSAFGDVVIEGGELVSDYEEDIAKIVKAAGV